ncbi:MAG: quinoprotein relay system zinc metallohydrolase 1 [Nevskia sp.]|uniref:quinoprotein relay system zinc metallohydrolase 1 n=1 Tax=Nevskia sp. TaxID=1929292 RepID=UPI0040351903
MSRLRLLAALTAAGVSTLASAAGFDYRLQPVPVADGVYTLIGKSENFSRDNGGNIVNTGFIIAPGGVIVIDSGPSKAYGEQQRAAIAKLTGKPVVQVLLTHAHPDHVLGSQAYPGVPVASLPATTATLTQSGDALLGNLYRLVGDAMRDTEVRLPNAEAHDGAVTIAGRKLRLIAARGHTDADLMVFDDATRTLFAGDLVFFDRTPTTPNADIPAWLATLDAIDALPFAALVPGHGPLLRDHAGIAQTRDYLRWLRDSLQGAARRGLDMPEVLQLPVPERFRHLAVLRTEYERSVSHLYPAYELDTLPTIPRSKPK